MLQFFIQTITVLYAHRLRSTLALLSIVVGIASVLVLVALGEGFYRLNADSFSEATNQTAELYPGVTSKSWRNIPSGKTIEWLEKDVSVLSQLQTIDWATLVYQKSGALITTSSGKPLSAEVIGIEPYFQKQNSFTLRPGSKQITEGDITKNRKIAILGNEVAQASGVKIGQSILIDQQPFTVTGILQQNDNQMGFNELGTQVFIPKTAYKIFWNESPMSILVKWQSGYSVDKAKAQLQVTLARLKNFDPKDREAIFISDFSDADKFIKVLLRGIQIFLGFCGAMTLAVGSLGVTNIMFLSVTERTKEIGLRMAIGATPKKILLQFITEGTLLILSGAIIGIMLSYFIVWGLGEVNLPDWLGTPVMSKASVLIVLAITFCLTILVVTMPARRAARMTPVVALSSR